MAKIYNDFKGKMPQKSWICQFWTRQKKVEKRNDTFQGAIPSLIRWKTMVEGGRTNARTDTCSTIRIRSLPFHYTNSFGTAVNSAVKGVVSGDSPNSDTEETRYRTMTNQWPLRFQADATCFLAWPNRQTELQEANWPPHELWLARETFSWAPTCLTNIPAKETLSWEQLYNGAHWLTKHWHQDSHAQLATPIRLSLCLPCTHCCDPITCVECKSRDKK